MTLTATPTVAIKRPASVTTCIAVLIFLGVTAIAGGFALLFDLGGGQPPTDWLEGVPLISTWLVPGLVLGIGFGIGSLVAAYGMVRRPRWAWIEGIERGTGHHWSWIATILIGAGHVLWIGLELIYLPEPTWLQAIYGPVGLALLLLPLVPTLSRYLRHTG
jgi:hypothetical protein